MKDKPNPEELKKLKHDGATAAELITQAFELNNVVYGVGMDALQCVYAYMNKENGVTYQEYCSAMDSMKKGYKRLWDKNE